MAESVQVHNQRESVALDMRVYSHLSAEERVRIDELRTQPIGERPKRVGPRRKFGHYESDTAVGASPSRRCGDTQVERRSRRLFAGFIPDKSALSTARAEYDIYKDIPAPARIDRTWDNGTESSCHVLVDEALGMLTYSMRTPTPHTSAARTRTATGASAATCPREPASTT